MRLLSSTVLSILLASVSLPLFTAFASAQIVITIGVPPPPLPYYDQPPIPDVGYIWTPGYWAYDDDYGYYWVPGTWVLPPQPGLLWTPGYWAFDDGNYVYYDGYWGEQVGFYGGVYYGYGYTGYGYEGGYWQRGQFFYNRSVNNTTNVNITNFYEKTVIAPATANNVSYNGGEGGLTARPTEQQEAFAHAQHFAPTAAQREHIQMASGDPTLRESQNKGRPAIAATSRPDSFNGPGVIAAKTAGKRPSGQSIPHGKIGQRKPEGAMAPSEGGVPSRGTNGQRPEGVEVEKRNLPGHAEPTSENRPAYANGHQPGAMTNTPERRLEPKPASEPRLKGPAMQPHMQPTQRHPEGQPHMQPPPQGQPRMEPMQHLQGQPHIQSHPSAARPPGGGEKPEKQP